MALSHILLLYDALAVQQLKGGRINHQVLGSAIEVLLKKKGKC